MIICSSRNEEAPGPLPSPVRSQLSMRRPSPQPEFKMVTRPGLFLLRQPLPWHTLQQTDRWLSGGDHCVPSLPSPPPSFTCGLQWSMHENPSCVLPSPGSPYPHTTSFWTFLPSPPHLPPGPLHRRRLIQGWWVNSKQHQRWQPRHPSLTSP